MIDNFFYFNNTYTIQIIQEKLESSLKSLKKDIKNIDDNEIGEVLDNWTRKNKYYVIYLINDDGSLLYTNDGIYKQGDTDVSFPNEKLSKISVNGVETNVSISYLFAAEVTSKITVIALISAIVVGLIVFVTLFKNIVDRIKKISYQLEIISGGDSQLTIYDNKNDEIGALVSNLNQMRKSLMIQYSQVEELENKEYHKIATLSHDIRTPLTVMKGYLDIVKSEQLNRDSVLYLEKIDEKISEIEHISLELFENLKEENKNKNQDFMSYEEFETEIKIFEENVTFSKFNVKLKIPSERINSKINITSSHFRQLLTNIHSNLIHYAAKDFPVEINCQVENLFLNIIMSNKVNKNKKIPFSSKKGLSLQKEFLREKNIDLNYFYDEGKFFLTIQLPLF
ncbi:HAMP domain-containing sensor histidine kinase [Enterococcus faecalis]|uniref:sensor histidine kinase n=1 Tax=Enterococcus faecalis TaxID=1351 RepID=UPI002FBE9420